MSYSDGSIFLRKDGRWCGEFYTRDEFDRLKKHTVYGTTKREAKEKMREAQQRHEQGMTVNQQGMAVREYLATWMRDVVSNKKSGTYRNYELVIRLYINPAIGHIKLIELTPVHVQRMLNDLKSRLSSTSVRYVRTVLSAALNQAIKWGYLSRNVARLTDVPKQQKFETQPLTEEQEQALLHAVSGTETTYMIFLVALRTGMRQGEILSLKWSDIRNGTIHIIGGKTGNRKIKLSQKMRATLEAYRKRQMTSSEYVFCNSKGKPIWANTIRLQLKKALQDAGLPESIRFHDLRHTCATRLLEKGENPRVVMELMGHANIGTTLNIYSHVSQETLQKAMERLEQSDENQDTNGEK